MGMDVEHAHLYTELSINLVISQYMRGEQEKQPLYEPPENLNSFPDLIGGEPGSRSPSPMLQHLEDRFRQEVSQVSVEKLSAGQWAEENSKEIFSQNTMTELYLAQTRQDQFMQSLLHLRDGIIQDQVLSHISHQGEKYQRLNYSMVKEYTKSRIEKMIKNRKVKKNWSGEDLKILVWIVAKYCEKKRIKDVYIGIEEQDWKLISSLIPGTTSQMCMFKWLSLKKSKVRDQKWQKRQQFLLQQLVTQYGEKNWGQISKQLFYKNPNKNKVYRCGKQCRQHWNCFLNPTIKKGNWTRQEDSLLVQLVYQAKGKKHWAKMIGRFGGRTENALKNRYSIIVDREVNEGTKKEDEMKILQKLMHKRFMEDVVQSKQEDKDSKYEFKSMEERSGSIKSIQMISTFEKMKEEEDPKFFEENEKGVTKEKIQINAMESEEKIIKPSKVVLLDDDRLEELRKKNSSLHYALQKNQTYHLASNHKNLEKNKSSD